MRAVILLGFSIPVLAFSTAMAFGAVERFSPSIAEMGQFDTIASEQPDAVPGVAMFDVAESGRDVAVRQNGVRTDGVARTVPERASRERQSQVRAKPVTAKTRSLQTNTLSRSNKRTFKMPWQTGVFQ